MNENTDIERCQKSSNGRHRFEVTSPIDTVEMCIYCHKLSRCEMLINSWPITGTTRTTKECAEYNHNIDTMNRHEEHEELLRLREQNQQLRFDAWVRNEERSSFLVALLGIALVSLFIGLFVGRYTL